MKRRRLCLALTLLVLALGVAIWFTPLHFVITGLLRQERFYQGLPTSYWRQEVKKDYEPGVPALYWPKKLLIPSLLQSATGKLSDPAAVPVLLELVRDDDPAVRQGAALALSNIAREPEAAVPVLLDSLSQPDPWGKQGAALALAQFGSEAKAAVPALIETLQLPGYANGDARYGAAVALGQIGPNAKAAVPALLVALKDARELVRQTAALALQNIAPEAAVRKGVAEPD